MSAASNSSLGSSAKNPRSSTMLKLNWNATWGRITPHRLSSNPRSRTRIKTGRIAVAKGKVSPIAGNKSLPRETQVSKSKGSHRAYDENEQYSEEGDEAGVAKHLPEPGLVEDRKIVIRNPLFWQAQSVGSEIARGFES